MEETRRDFLKKLGAASAVLASGDLGTLAIPPVATIPQRSFGKIGWKVGILGFGTAELAGEAESIAALNAALDDGVNYIDTAPSYQSARSETYVGKVAKSRRKEFYLATKTIQRGRAGALREIKESLARLQTNHIDLLQIHAVNRMSELDEALAKGGAIEGLEEAKKNGLIRHIGITGHTRPEVLLKAIERYPFESALVPLSPADASLNDFGKAFVPEARRRGVAVVAMKALKGAQRSADGLGDPVALLHYAFSLPVATAIVGMVTPAHVAQNAKAARDFRPLSAARMREMESTAKAYATTQALWWKGQ